MFENIGESWVTDTQLRKDVRTFLTNGTLNTSSLTAKVTTKPELTHEPANYDEVILTVDLLCPSDSDPAKVGSVAVSFQALLNWGGRDILPDVDDEMVKVVDDEMVNASDQIEKNLTAALNEVGDALTAYADAFIRLGPEPQSSIDAVERLKVRAFLSGGTTAELHGTSGTPLVISASMDVTSHDLVEIENKRLSVDVKRKLDESTIPVGKVMVTIGRAVNEHIISYLQQFDLSVKEVAAIDEHVHAKLSRFIELGAEPELV